MSTIEKAFKKLNKQTENVTDSAVVEVNEEELARIQQEYDVDIDPKEFWDAEYSKNHTDKNDLAEQNIEVDSYEYEVQKEPDHTSFCDNESELNLEPKLEGEQHTELETESNTSENLDAQQNAPIPNRIDYFELDFKALDEESIIVPNSERQQLIEEYRVIKRPVIKNAIGESAAEIVRGNLIMMTSALPGEGKTYSSVNLAMSIAMEFDRTVLLVDADVARPSVSKLLGIPQDQLGLTDVLDDPSLNLPDVLIRTNIDNLVVLPAGRPHRLSTELLASEGMLKMTKDLSERYADRIVIFDSPPLLLTSEASVLAGIMGQVILVIEANVTPQQAVKDALSTVASNDVVSLLLNKSKGKSAGSYYGGYGFYHKDS